MKSFAVISPFFFMVVTNFSSSKQKCIKIPLFHREFCDCNSEMVMLCYSQPEIKEKHLKII